jgi:hypothetical protein
MTNRSVCLITGLVLAISTGICGAQVGGKPPSRSQAAPAAQHGYVPPVRGAPARRVGGSSRGVDDELPNVAVLVPEHTGLTSAEQPVLYWYLSKPTSVPIEITLIQESAIQPLIEVSAGSGLQPGIHALRLSDHGVRLVAGVEYEWSVALVLNRDERSHDVISAGAIMHVQRTDEEMSRMRGVDRESVGMAYAQEGMWYDAIAALSEGIAADPTNEVLRRQRARVLAQAGLDEPAAHDARFPSPASANTK